jgi:hypothetical protein
MTAEESQGGPRDQCTRTETTLLARCAFVGFDKFETRESAFNTQPRYAHIWNHLFNKTPVRWGRV